MRPMSGALSLVPLRTTAASGLPSQTTATVLPPSRYTNVGSPGRRNQPLLVSLPIAPPARSMSSPRDVSRAENVAADAGSAAVAIPQPMIAPMRIFGLFASPDGAFTRYLLLSNNRGAARSRARGDLEVARSRH